MAPTTAQKGPPSQTTGLRSHEQERAASYALLEKARSNAAKECRYNSQEARRSMTERCQQATGLVPYPEQLDIAECVILGVDCTVIARTGWGKTLPFALPQFYLKDRIIIIQSPLNVLEVDQETRFNKMGLSAIALNSETYTDDVHKAIVAGKYNIILAGPELCLNTEGRFRPLLRTPTFAKRIAAYIIDEAHCITQWGDSFRTTYSELGTLRAFTSLKIPVVALSATFPPAALEQARKSLLINADFAFHLNIGNDRPNIAWEVRHMATGKSSYESLAFLIPENLNDDSQFSRTMVFFDDISISMKARRWFLSQIPESLRHRVKTYNSRMTAFAKRRVMKLFRRGKIDILFTTEAAGMGCDIPDIEVVVQYMVPGSLSIWMQRAGRAGRLQSIKARAVLLVQPSIFQERGRATRREGDEIIHVKEIEEGLRRWIETTECRRNVSDVYFNNPPGRKCTSQLRQL
ncbi:P-loop containing nucleoside triphosphate hydrolase protein [Cristinia sonorae]|uniref:DNA 3'-5' helicase n=1 Tax=Cristinia sonorae TaxID=1940300 RepID=A0A8K0XMM0_9AGAR|nr:P-loop containing nucleoside triphosphate hydrolase protein [Cristinia sonorae]